MSPSPSPTSPPSRRLAVVPPPADDVVARSAEPGAGPAPSSTRVRAVVGELVEAAVTIGEDVELVVEDTVGEALAAGERSW
ncbi:MAG TPA: hypothetical protein VK935_01820, partial [Actinomycetospora sp.]|nr:hypothetical protein [Actinomycetospora sp.]